MSPRARWPVDVRTRVRVARRYFLDQATKVEIGAEFGLTRFQVARVVQDCLDDGTVSITIRGPAHLDEATGDRIVRRFGLVDALVTDDLAGVGRFAVSALAAHLDDGAVLAVDRTPAVEALMADGAAELPRCAVVQVRGVSGLDDHGIELVKRVALGCGGEAYPIYAPFLSRTAADAATLRQHPLVGVATGRLDAVAAAVLGASPPSAWPELPATGAAAALGPVLLDAAGQPLAEQWDGRAIGLDARQLRRIPFVLAVATGADEADALRAALEGGLAHAVVLDAAAAQRLVALSGEE